MTEPNRQQYANVCADAYVTQYMTGPRVMNQPVVTYYPPVGFEWQSSLTPTTGELIVDQITDGMYGDTAGATPEIIRAAIVDYITDHDYDDAWGDIVDQITAHNWG
jgi:hypothetical protein